MRAGAHAGLLERRRAVSRARGRRRRTIVLAVLAAAAALAGGWWLLTGPLVTVNRVTVTGYGRADRAALEVTARLAARGGSVVDPPTERIRSALSRFPWVERVSVGRDLPRGLVVRVATARPLAVAEPTQGPPVLVSAAGRVLAPAPARPGLARIRLQGPAPAPGAYLRDGPTRASLAMVGGLDRTLARRVRGLRLESRLLSARLAGGPWLRLGPPERLPAKAAALLALLNHLSPAEEKAATYIDVGVPERPVLGTEKPKPSTRG